MAGHNKIDLDKIGLEQFLKLAHHLADLSAEAILPHFREALMVENKATKTSSSAMVKGDRDGANPAQYDPVTVADRAAEKIIREHLIEAVPDHGIIGEEFAETAGASSYCWIIDPIDGTRSFIMGYPIWGTLIGLKQENQPVLGLMNQPFTGERFWSDGSNSFMRYGSNAAARKLRTRDCKVLTDAIFSTTDPYYFTDGYEDRCFRAVSRKAAMTRFGGDCYAYAMLAAGLVDIILETDLKPYDIVALIPIIEHAGGVITSWDGGTPVHGNRVLASANAALHEQALKLLDAQTD